MQLSIYPSIKIYVLCAHKNGLIETVLNHNICFDWEIFKNIFKYASLPRSVHIFHRARTFKIEIIFLSINLNMCLGAQKNRLIERVLLSTHNICFVEK